MIHVELNIQRRHLIILAGILTAALLLVPGISWASDRFSDVPTNNMFHNDIAWLADTGVTLGCNTAGTLYCPDDNVTRGEMAAFMHRLYTNTVTPLETKIGALETLLAGVTRNGDTLLLTGMNLQVVNGAGTTDTANGLGNVIIGYNEDNSNTRTGSHMLVIGDRHTYTSYGGIVAGYANTTTGPYATITGGSYNTASGNRSSVSGGIDNTASGQTSSVSGGGHNVAESAFSSVSGGSDNRAGSEASSVSGGRGNTASGNYSSVSGGTTNTASGQSSSASGGTSNTASGNYSSLSGGYNNTTTAAYSAIGGGDNVTCTSAQVYFCAEGSVTAAD